MSSIFGKSSLSPEWAERFREVAKLNAYAQSTPVRLSGVVIEGYDLSGTKLSGAEFEKTEWKNITLKSGEFINAKFIHSSFDNVKFENATFKDTVFEDVTFDDFAFFQTQLQNVRFVRCQFSGAALQSLKASTITIEDSKLEDMSFYRSAVIATVRGSKFNDVDMRSLQAPSSLTFEKSELKEVNFERSILERFVLNHVKADMGGTGGGRINVVEIRDSQFGLSFSETQIDSFTVSKSTIETALNSATIKSLDLVDCKGMKDMTLYKAKIGRMRVQNCHLNDFALVKATVEEFSATNAQLTKNQFMNSKIKTMTLENVSLDGKVDFTNAHIDQLTTKNITKLPGLNLITTGSNVKLD